MIRRSAVCRRLRDAVMCFSSVFLLLGLGSWTVSGAGEASSANLLVNPSFEGVGEKGAPAEWSFVRTGDAEGSLGVTDQARTGKSAAVLAKTGAAGRDGVYAVQILRQDIEPDRTYVFTAWVKALSPGEPRFDLYLEARGEDAPPGIKRRYEQKRETFVPTRQWKQYRVELPIGGEHRYVGMRMIVQLYSADSSIAVDDAALVTQAGAPRQQTTVRKGARYYSLGRDVVTPHIAWAKPYCGGAVRALVIAPQMTQRETVELAQRMDLDFTTAFVVGAGRLGWRPGSAAPYEKVDGMFQDDVERDILEKLGRSYDVIVLGSINWDTLTLDVKYELLRAVKGGAGLVIGFEPSGTDEIFKKAMFTQGTHDREKFITAGVPVLSLPYVAEYETVDAARSRYLWLAQLGKGRIVCLRYGGDPHYYWRYLSPPHQRHSLSRSFLEYDYYLSLAVKAILWAARREPDVLVRSIAAGQSSVKGNDLDEETLTLELVNTGDDRELTFATVVRDPDGRVEREASVKRSVPAGAATLALKLGSVPAGRHFVDVFMREGATTVNWASIAIDVTGPVSITSIELEREDHGPGDTIKGRLVLAGVPLPDTRAMIALHDNHGRLLERRSRAVPENASAVDFALPAGTPLAVMHRIVAEVVRGETVLSRAQLDFPIRMAPPDDFQWIVWNSGSPDYVMRYALRQLRRLGVDAVLAPGMYGLAGTRHADVVYRENLQLVPYCTRLTDTRTDSYNRSRKGRSGADLVREPCLTDPAYLETEKARVGGTAEGLAKYGPIAYSLGDEGGFSNGKHDLCHSETCQADFRVFLRGLYGTLDALNAEWSTSYGSWDEIRKMTLDEARSHNNFAPWCDHRLHGDSVWTRTNALLRDEIRKHQPGAKVGAATYSYIGSYTATDWPRFAETIDFIETYTLEQQTPSLVTVKAIERDFFRNRDVLFGYCYGAYEWVGLWSDRNEDTQRYYPWRILFEGGNSVFWFMGLSGSAMRAAHEGGGLAPDLSPHDILMWSAEEIGEVKRGAGKLLMNADRLHDGVAILYSQSSIHASVIDERLTNILERRQFMVPYMKLLADLGINELFISTHDVDGGRLDRGDIRALILPFCQALSDEQCRRIMDFANAGGTVIADLRPAVMDAHCKWREAGGLDELFGTVHGSTDVALAKGEVRATTPGGGKVSLATWGVAEANLRPTTAAPLGTCADTPVLFLNPYGEGRGVYLGFSMDRYESSWQDERGAGMRAMWRELLEQAQVRPQPAITSDNDVNLRALRRARFSCGRLGYLGLVRDIEGVGGPPDKSPRPLHVELPDDVHLYDVRKGRYLGATDSFDTTIVPARAQVYAMLPYEVKCITIGGLKKSCEPGDTVALSLRVQPTGGQAGRHVLRVELSCPQGGTPTPYARNVIADEGKCDTQFRLALNDPPGEWVVTVRDVATGTVAQERFTLGGAGSAKSRERSRPLRRSVTCARLLAPDS